MHRIDYTTQLFFQHCRYRHFRNNAGVLNSAGLLGWHIPALFGVQHSVLVYMYFQVYRCRCGGSMWWYQMWWCGRGGVLYRKKRRRRKWWRSRSRGWGVELVHGLWLAQNSPKTVEIETKQTKPGVLGLSKPKTGTTPIPDELCWDVFEMYYKMRGTSAKLDQWNTSFVGILLRQTRWRPLWPRRLPRH